MAKKVYQRKPNTSSPTWLLMGLYPLGLLVVVGGVLFGGWMNGLAHGESVIQEQTSEQDDDEWIRKLGITEIEQKEPSEMTDDELEELLQALLEEAEERDLSKQLEDLNGEEDLEDLEDDEEEFDWENSASEDDEEESEEEEEEILEPDEEFAGCYYYEHISESDQEAYSLIYHAYMDLKGTRVSVADFDALERVHYLVQADHPEIFYVDGFSYRDEGGGSFLINPSLAYDEGKIVSRRVMNEAAADEIIADMPGGLDDYHKIMYFFNYLVDNTDYDLDAEDNQEISSVFLNHVTVCAGYAKAMQYLLLKSGVQALYVCGDTPRGLHAWNIVQVDGKYYQLDVCWADFNDDGLPQPEYAYMCIPTSRIQVDHQADTDVYPIPECNSMDSCYYVKEDCYVTSIDDAQLQDIFERGRLANNGTVYIMASDERVFNGLVDYLFNQRNVCRLYFGDGNQSSTVWHYMNDRVYTIAVYLGK